MSDKFSVVLSGNIADGFELSQVKGNIANVFKLPLEKVERLFTGKPVALKRGIGKAQAMKLRNVLARAGALGVIKADAVKLADAESVTVAAEVVQAEPVNSNIICPRCAHKQPHTMTCGLCKMDLSLHIQRVKRREKINAKRHLLRSQAAS